MDSVSQAKTAFKDVYHWKYDPFFCTYYHEHTGVLFHEDMLTKWKWGVKIIPHEHYKYSGVCPLLHWAHTRDVKFDVKLWWLVFKNLKEIERHAKWVCC